MVSFGNTYPTSLRWHLYQYPALVQAWERCQTCAHALPAAQKAAAAASEKVGAHPFILVEMTFLHRSLNPLVADALLAAEKASRWWRFTLEPPPPPPPIGCMHVRTPQQHRADCNH